MTAKTCLPDRIMVDAEGVIWTMGAHAHADTFYRARPGQPCSADEFLRRVMSAPLSMFSMLVRVRRWVAGDFIAAMEGLE